MRLIMIGMLVGTVSAVAGNKFVMNDVKNAGVVGALTSTFLQRLAQSFDAKVFVETGTYLGDTTFIAAEYFADVRTIELDKKLYELASAKFAKNQKVRVYQGDSTTMLPEIVSSIKGTAVFWLDGHFSCGNTAKGALNTPILAELATVAQYKDDAIILIDDVRYFQNSPQSKKEGTNASDYPDLTEIIGVLEGMKRDYKYLVIGDVLLAYPSKYVVEASAVVKACTVSRLFGTGLYTSEELHASEKIIAQALGHEAKTLGVLCKTFDVNESKQFGLACYYHQWYALHLARRDKKRAARHFARAKESNGAYFSR